MVAPLKRRVPFHINRMVALALLAAIPVAVFVLRTENTRTQIGSVKNNIANRCVQHDDNACRKLLDRLLDVSKRNQQQKIRDIILQVSAGKGGRAGGGSNPSGQPGGLGAPSNPTPPSQGPVPTNPTLPPIPPTPPTPRPPPVVQGVQNIVDGVQGTVNGLVCMLAPQQC